MTDVKLKKAGMLQLVGYGPYVNGQGGTLHDIKFFGEISVEKFLIVDIYFGERSRG